MKSRYLSILVIIILAIICLLFWTSEKKEQPIIFGRYSGSNIIIISIDSLRADHLGCYGYQRETSQNIDSIAKQGAIFENSFSPRGLTWPSITSMLTSKYPTTHGVLFNGYLLDREKFITIADILSGEEYITASFLASYYEAGGYGFEFSRTGNDIEITKEFLKWLKQNKNEKFFSYIHYLNPHKPYRPDQAYDIFTISDYEGIYMNSPSLDKKVDNITRNQLNLSEKDLEQIISLYDGEIHQTDVKVGEIINSLKDFGLLNNTILIVTSDHGEELYQHNAYFYHGCSLYDSVLRIPLIIRFPDGKNEAVNIENIVENLDIAPTILDLLGIENNFDFEGSSFLPALNFEDEQNEAAFGEWGSRIKTVRTKKWKYIYNPDNYTPVCFYNGDDWILETEELYDIRNDSNETLNLAEKNPEIIFEFKKDIELRDKGIAIPETDMADEETLERLRNLGYIT